MQLVIDVLNNRTVMAEDDIPPLTEEYNDNGERR